jgi:hypothetical protein
VTPRPSRIRFAFPPPDWVMAGMPNPDGPGVWLLASKEVGPGLMRGGTIGRDDDGLLTGSQVRLMIELAGFLVIEAPDYPTAFRLLFERWSPEPEPRPALEAARPAIVPRRPQIGGGR